MTDYCEISAVAELAEIWQPNIGLHTLNGFSLDLTAKGRRNFKKHVQWGRADSKALPQNLLRTVISWNISKFWFCWDWPQMHGISIQQYSLAFFIYAEILEDL